MAKLWPFYISMERNGNQSEEIFDSNGSSSLRVSLAGSANGTISTGI